MQTIEWTAGTGAKIAVSVSVGFELNRQGIRKTSGRMEVILTATLNGHDHFCPRGLMPVKHPVAVAMLGDIGLMPANYDRVVAAIAAAESEIAAHNAACDTHAAKLDAVDAASASLAKSMSHGEIR